MSTAVGLRTETSKKVKELTDRYYRELRESREQGRKVAWCLGPVPFGPLAAMDQYVRFAHLENYGARLAARNVATFIHKVGEDWGFAKDVCSYLRGAQGMSLCCAQNVPLPTEIKPYWIPNPDFILVQNYCLSAVNMAEVMHHELKIPVYIIDVVFHYRDDDPFAYLDYVKQALQGAIAFIEEQVGHRMDYDRLSEVVALLKEMGTLRNQVLDMGKNIPAPITAFDALISMGAGLLWCGKPESVEYFKLLKAEIQERVANKVAAVPNEKIRLLWDFIAVWPKIGHLSNLFASHNAAVVFSQYSRGAQGYFPDHLDPSDPVTSLARDLANATSWRHINEWVRSYVDIVNDFSIDGAIVHSPRTCRKLSIDQKTYFEEVSRRTGIPVLQFDADHSDPDFYSPAQIDTRIIAFLEMLEARKARARV